MMKYRISRVRMVIPCEYYDGLYHDCRDIICRNITKELNGVDISDVLFQTDLDIKYNPIEKLLIYQSMYMSLCIDIKTHNKIRLLNPDYRSRKVNIGEIQRKFRKYRHNPYFSDRFRNHFRFVVEEYNESHSN